MDIRNRTQARAGHQDASEPARAGVLQHRFDDFDDLCEKVQGWNLDLHRFDRGPFEAELLQAMVGSVQVSRAFFEGRLQQQGAPPPDTWTFGIPEPSSTPFDWRGYKIDGEQVLIFRPGSELDSVSERGFRVFTCSFSEELLEQVAVDAGLPLPGQALRGAEVVKLSRQASFGIQSWFLGLFAALAEDASRLASPTFRAQVERELPARLLAGIGSGTHTPRPRPIGTRQQTFDLALAYIAEHAHRAPTVAEVAAAIDANERTLRRAFLDRLGVSPKTYLTAVRLAGARRELRASLPEVQVRGVANRWGFWHMGDFAMRYQLAFGERPSETRRMARAD